MELSNIQYATIVKRPSATCKTPYVADIQINGQENFLGHCPALGCCGLSDKGSTVLVTPVESKTKSKTNVCQYRVDLAIYEEDDNKVIVGINPKLAEHIMYGLLEKNAVPFLKIQSFEREKKMLNSRFDFMGIDETERTFVMEIKNVPLADYVDVPKKERKKYNTSHLPFDEKIAYFPDGYRKNSTDVVSPRALKHIEELETVAKTTDMRPILCFLVQRPDVTTFQPSNIDLTYKRAVQHAWKNGVEIYALQMVWDENGICNYKKNLPVVLFEEYGPQILTEE